MEKKVIKTEEQILKDKKAWSKKSLRIWRVICKRVRIIEVGDQYVVQGRKYLGLFPGWSEWSDINTFSTMKQAIRKKNMQIVLIVMRDLTCRTEFIHRRNVARKLRLGY